RKDALWQALAENGLTLSWVSEDHGGSGAGLADGFELLSAAGRFAVPVPLAETMLAGWLLSQGGIVSPDGPMSVAPVEPKDRITLDGDGRLSGRAQNVPFAREAQHGATRRRSSRQQPRRSVAPRRQAQDQPSPTRCMARSASPRSMCCIVSACARWAGATTSATRATGRSSSATWLQNAAPTI